MSNVPNLFQQMVNFANSSAQHIRNGMKHVDEKEFDRRLSICKECPSLIKDQDRCGECGCYLKTKALWESSECPLGKWKNPARDESSGA